MQGALKGTLGGPSDGTGRKPSVPHEIKVPDVEGLTEQEALLCLAEASLKTEIRRQEGSEEDAGRVLEQSVSGGKKADKDSKVLLTVGKAPQAARVPDLVGLSYPEAETNWRKRAFFSAA